MKAGRDVIELLVLVRYLKLMHIGSLGFLLHLLKKACKFHYFAFDIN